MAAQRLGIPVAAPDCPTAGWRADSGGTGGADDVLRRVLTSSAEGAAVLVEHQAAAPGATTSR